MGALKTVQYLAISMTFARQQHIVYSLKSASLRLPIAMIQRISIPCSFQLRQIVNFMSYVEFTDSDNVDNWTAIFPNATTNFVITLNDKIQLNHSWESHSLYASCASTVAIKPFVGLQFVTVQLNHFGLYALTGIPASELSDSLLKLDDIFDQNDIGRLTERLKDADSVQYMFQILETFFLQQSNAIHFNPRLPAALQLIKQFPNIRMDDISTKVCLSTRSLHNLFLKHVGMSPSYFKKITRFNLAANSILNDSTKRLSDVAASFGYFDQSHFIKDFKHFAHISPSEFINLKAKCSDFYNYSLKDIGSFN